MKITKEKLLIIGASGHGKVVLDVALNMKKWKEIKFLDDNESINKVMGIEIIGKSCEAEKYIEDYQIFVAIGNNSIRQIVQENLKSLGADIPVLIHQSSIIGNSVNIGQGTVIMAGAIINSCTKIGEGSIINTRSTVEHDSIIGDYVHISSGASLAGTVIVGSSTWIGIGSVVSNNINITDNCIVGAGSVVIRDIFREGTYVGIPARRLEERKVINFPKLAVPRLLAR